MSLHGFQAFSGTQAIVPAGVPPSVAGESYQDILGGPAAQFPLFTVDDADVTGVTIVTGGSGYAAGNTITLPSGVVLNVITVTAGAVTSVTISNDGSAPLLGLPLNPVSQVSTSGTGTGATFNLTWQSLPLNIAPAGVPPSVAGIPLVTYKTGSASTPANLFPGHFSTSPPYPPIAISATFNNVTLQAGNLTNPWRITLPPTTPTVAILSLNLNDAGEDENEQAGKEAYSGLLVGPDDNGNGDPKTKTRAGKRARKP